MKNLDIKNLLLYGTKSEIADAIDSVHPADILDILDENPDKVSLILSKLPDDIVADIIEEEEDEDKYNLLEQLKERQKAILYEMSDDEIVDLIGELEDDEKQSVISHLDNEDKKHVQELLNYSKESAGGLMTTEYVALYADKTVLEAYEYLQKHVEEDAKYYLYVIDKTNILKGVVSLRDIVISSFDTKIEDIANKNVKSVYYYEDQEDVANTFKKYNYIMMPVIDEKDHLLGVIEIDDVMDVIEQETNEDINLMAGMSSEERVDSTIYESFKSRIPWLIINLATAVMAASVVNEFSNTIAKVVSLSAVMSIVSGMGGNAGTQSLTILVRGLSLGEIDHNNALKIFFKEIIVGVLTGVVIGIFVGFGSYYYAGNFYFGIVAALAMILNMVAANIAGFLVPVILRKCRIDPALASGVFVTTVTDCLGFFFFLGLATLFISHL